MRNSKIFNSGAFGCSLVLSGGLPAQLDHAPLPRVAFCFAGTSRPCPARLEAHFELRGLNPGLTRAGSSALVEAT
jgi:hypothetical protein